MSQVLGVHSLVHNFQHKSGNKGGEERGGVAEAIRCLGDPGFSERRGQLNSLAGCFAVPHTGQYVY